MIEVAAGKPIWALGFMTGTSMDGLDAACVRTDGVTIERFGPCASKAYSTEEAAALRDAIDWCSSHWPNNGKLRNKTDLWDIVPLRVADETLVQSHLELEHQVADEFLWLRANHRPEWLEGLGRELQNLQAIGFHGQTVLHRPEAAYTLQIGDPVLLAEGAYSGAQVVHDFRSEDVTQGGQGAPLAPFYHFALAKHIGAIEPIVFLNIGGVANITWVDPTKEKPEEDGALLAFDTGPGNALINDWMKAQTCADYDADGAAAATGRVYRDRLTTNSGQAYLRRPGPKSLDRNDFHGVLGAMEGLSTEDGAATLTAFTVDCVAASVRHMPSPPSRWLVCGGGRLNKTMMAMLANRLDAPVEPVEVVGLDGDMLEAQAFAFLAVRVLRGLPTSAPSTTGCCEPVCGGRISYPTG